MTIKSQLDTKLSELETLRDLWDECAQTDLDAMHHIATNRTDWSTAEFFDTGIEEIRQVLHNADRLGYVPRLSALDFGCGMGRCTNALGDWFESVVGMDLSPAMVKLARENQRHSHVHYVESGADLLTQMRGRRFTFVFSTLTLQHIPRHMQGDYIGQLLDMLDVRGVAVLTMPTGPDYHNEWKLQLSMYCMTPDVMQSLVENRGCEIKAVELKELSGPFTQLRYYIRRSL